MCQCEVIAGSMCSAHKWLCSKASSCEIAGRESFDIFFFTIVLPKFTCAQVYLVMSVAFYNSSDRTSNLDSPEPFKTILATLFLLPLSHPYPRVISLTLHTERSASSPFDSRPQPLLLLHALYKYTARLSTPDTNKQLDQTPSVPLKTK